MLALTVLLVTDVTPGGVLAQSAATTAPPAARSETLLGVGVWSRPAYLGSDERMLSVIPIIRYYGRPWFARTTQGMLEAGARALLAGGLSLGTQVAWEVGRDSEDSGFLESRDVPTLSVSASIGVHAGWDLNLGRAPVTLLMRYRKEVASDRGAQADLRATVGVYGGERLRLGLFTQATWADATSNQAYYGVTAAQSTTTGLPVFTGTAGMANRAAGLLWSYGLGPNWLLQGNIEGRQLSAALRESPLTQVRSNAYVSAGLAYRF